MTQDHDHLATLRALNKRFIHNFVTNDVPSHDAILHPEFSAISPSGAHEDRASYLHDWATGFDANVILYWDMRDERISVVGNTALVRATNKWLRRIEVSDVPFMTREETSKYTDLMPDGRALKYTLKMDVKSIITHPSVGMKLSQQGLYEVSGLAWSGQGAIKRVEVTADGGKSWADAELSGPVLPKCLTRFRIPWSWTGGPATLASRATDERGNVQPTHEVAISRYGDAAVYHYNGIQPWAVAQTGEVANVRM